MELVQLFEKEVCSCQRMYVTMVGFAVSKANTRHSPDLTLSLARESGCSSQLLLPHHAYLLPTMISME